MGAIEGAVRDEDGLPVEKCHVVVYPVSRDGARARRHSIQGTGLTDDRRHYRIGGLVAGAYIVSARRDGVEFFFAVNNHRNPEAIAPMGTRMRRAFHPVALRPADAAPVMLQPGEERFGIDISFPDTRGHPISGVVVNPDGSPAPGAHILVTSLKSSAGFGFEAFHAAALDGGRFETEALAPDIYQLTVSVTKMARATPGTPVTSLFAEAAVNLGAAPTEGVVLQLQSPLRVRGSVVMPPLPAASEGAPFRCAESR